MWQWAGCCYPSLFIGHTGVIFTCRRQMAADPANWSASMTEPRGFADSGGRSSNWLRPSRTWMPRTPDP
jgi:hypothetical protein